MMPDFAPGLYPEAACAEDFDAALVEFLVAEAWNPLAEGVSVWAARLGAASPDRVHPVDIGFSPRS